MKDLAKEKEIKKDLRVGIGSLTPLEAAQLIQAWFF